MSPTALQSNNSSLTAQHQLLSSLRHLQILEPLRIIHPSNLPPSSQTPLNLPPSTSISSQPGRRLDDLTPPTRGGPTPQRDTFASTHESAPRDKIESVAIADEPEADHERDGLRFDVLIVGVDDAVPELGEFGEQAGVAGDDVDSLVVVQEGEFASLEADLAVNVG
jgi:hypothetical protein